MKRILRRLGILALWGVGALIAYAVFTNVSETTAIWLGIVIGAYAVNYEFQTIKEKLANIQATLDDMRGVPDYDDDLSFSWPRHGSGTG
jgi:hypothetical protein